MSVKTIVAALCVGLGFSLSLPAVELPAIFRDNLVLQRGCPVAVWGGGAPGEDVTVEFAGQKVSGQTAADGRWQVSLAPLAVNAVGQELKVSGKNTIVLKNVVVGDVWLCVGQSNLQWALKGIVDGPAVVAAAANPDLRLFQPPLNWNRQPDFNGKGDWKPSTPASAAGFSAVAFMFGNRLQKELKIPIGLICIAWGGCRVESLMPVSSLTSNPILANSAKEYEKILKQPDTEVRKDKQRVPAGIFNAMISPVTPYTLRGSIYYQGEDNHYEGAVFGDKLKIMIAAWRQSFRKPELPIYLVQLPPYVYDKNKPNVLAPFRLGQQNFAESDPHAGFIVTTDCGNPADIHPKEKRPLAARLATLVLFREYQIGDDSALSPTVKQATFGNGQATVEFKHANGLKTRDGAPVSCLELAGKDKVFHPAQGSIANDRLTVRSDKVADPVAVRFCWNNVDNPNLVNRAGVPVAPFLSQK